MEYTDFDGKYLKIRKAIHEAGFDDFCQAGSISRFHKMNIVAERIHTTFPSVIFPQISRISGMSV